VNSGHSYTLVQCACSDCSGICTHITTARSTFYALCCALYALSVLLLSTLYFLLSVKRALEGVDCMIHIAALVGPFFPTAAYRKVRLQRRAKARANRYKSKRRAREEQEKGERRAREGQKKSKRRAREGREKRTAREAPSQRSEQPERERKRILLWHVCVLQRLHCLITLSPKRAPPPPPSLIIDSGQL
jgi:hypothetical protein